MSTISVALIGVGYWGPNLCRTLNSNPNIHLKTVVDTNAERQQYVRDNYPQITLSAELETVLTDPEIDGVVIATPVKTHFNIAKKCIEAKKHILVEKPLTTSIIEAQELKKLGKKHNTLIMVGHTFLYNPAVHYIKELIDSGELGDIISIHSQRLNFGRIRDDVDALWNFAPHDISIIQYWLNDATPIQIHRMGSSTIQENIEDITSVLIKYSKKCFAHIHVSWLNPVKIRKMTIVGSKKMVEYDDTAERKVTIFNKGIHINATLNQNMDYDAPSESNFIYRSGDITIPHIDWIEPLKNEIQHFADCIRHKTPCRTGVDHAISVVDILERASITSKNDTTESSDHV